VDNRGRTDVDIIDCSKALALVPHDGLQRKTVASGGDPRIVVWTREFLLVRTQRE
jgi:hypothetical protein